MESKTFCGICFAQSVFTDIGVAGIERRVVPVKKV